MGKVTLKPKKLARLQAQALAALGKNLLDLAESPTTGYSPVGHGHAIADVTGLQTALDGKAALLLPIATKTASYTATAADRVLLVDASSGAVTITLAALVPGREIAIKKIDSSANAVTIDGAGTDTIDGVATLSLPAQYDAATLVATAGGWWII